MVDYTRIDGALMDRLAKIAKLNLTEEESVSYAQQLKDILEVFKVLDEVDTKDVRPSFQPTKIENIWREDLAEAHEWSPLESTRHSENLYFKGPKIV